ncbi:MAG: hypothetical protein PVI88_04195 [Nitrosopumilaceae archaeon]|jgi:methyl-accepting chemotaxis protein
MKEFNSVPSWNENKPEQITIAQTVGTIQNVSKNIREHAFQIRETMKTLRQTGAITEIAMAIRESSFAIRDTVRDINETTKELQKNGILNDTASAVENTLENAEQSVTTVKQITSDVKSSTPHTATVVKNGIDVISQETSQMTEKVMLGIKNKVGKR